MSEDLFLITQSVLLTRKSSLRFALAFLLCSMITSADDRRRGGAALQASGFRRSFTTYQMFDEVEALASPKYSNSLAAIKCLDKCK